MYKLLLICLVSLVNTCTFAQQLDPTKPFTSSATGAGAGAQNFKLYSVIIKQNSRKAIINNRTLVVGENIDDFKVVQIEKQKVILQSSTETLELFLFTNALANK